MLKDNRHAHPGYTGDTGHTGCTSYTGYRKDTYKFCLRTGGYPVLGIRWYRLRQARIEAGRSFFNKVYGQAVIITDGNLEGRW